MQIYVLVGQADVSFETLNYINYFQAVKIYKSSMAPNFNGLFWVFNNVSVLLNVRIFC